MSTIHGTTYVDGDRDHKRDLYVVEVSHPEDIPQPLAKTGEFFTALIVWNAAGVEVDAIARLARWLIDSGGVSFCTWGTDCERVHDVIDEEWVGEGNDSRFDETLMTTWHDDEPLAKAVWYALHLGAIPIDKFFDECRSVIAFCIGCPKLAVEVREIFSDVERFNQQMTKDQ